MGIDTPVGKEECMSPEKSTKNLTRPPKSITKSPEFNKIAPQRIAERSDGDRAKGNCKREKKTPQYLSSNMDDTIPKKYRANHYEKKKRKKKFFLNKKIHS